MFSKHCIVQDNPLMTPLLLRARKAAEVSDINVLLEGETGAGKKVLAQGIHRLDRNRERGPPMS
jgi:transcriptional regulator with PAS, ATPase and Fis domain